MMNVLRRLWDTPHFGPALVILMLLICIAPSKAQTITDDQVNDVASKLYCPVCENIPLDVCGTQACQEWRDEIRTQLSEGYSEQQVIDDFVGRFGDRVVGTPQDPTLRALSLITPWILGLLAVVIAAWTFLRWRGGLAKASPVEAEAASDSRDEDYYRSQIEADLASRR
jgi:cytochrome c-type biogenesis protein CcmH